VRASRTRSSRALGAVVSEVDHPERLLVRPCAAYPIAIRVNDGIASGFYGRGEHDRIPERELGLRADVGRARGEIEEERNDGQVRKRFQVPFSSEAVAQALREASRNDLGNVYD